MLMARSSSFGTRCSAPRAHLSEGLRDDILSDSAVSPTQIIAVILLLALNYYKTSTHTHNDTDKLTDI